MKYVVFYLTIFSFLASVLRSDFAVTTVKKIDVTKEQKIIAKLDDDEQKRSLEGFLAVARNKQNDNYIININWINLIDKNNKKTTVRYATAFEQESKILKRRTSLLVKGNLPTSFEINNKEDEKNSRKDFASRGSSETVTNIQNPSGSVFDSSVSTPEVVTTYNGCDQVFNISNDTISVMQRSYYISDTGREITISDCKQVKLVPATFQSCSTLHNYSQGISIARRQAVFSEDNKTYSAGGCLATTTYTHEFVEDGCSAITVEDRYYIRTGKVQYTDSDTYDVSTLTGCIVNPKDGESPEKQLLKVEYGSCDINHDLDAGHTIAFGRYYYEQGMQAKKYVSSCVLTYLSELNHLVEFLGWTNFDNERYAIKNISRYILYPENSAEYQLQPNQKIYVTGQEQEGISYPYEPISIKTQVVSYAKSSGEGSSYGVCPNGVGKPAGSKPNPNAYVTRGSSRSCTYYGNVGSPPPTQSGTNYRGKWQWVEYVKQCDVVYNRPDGTVMEFNDWQDLISSWDETAVNNAVCK